MRSLLRTLAVLVLQLVPVREGQRRKHGARARRPRGLRELSPFGGERVAETDIRPRALARWEEFRWQGAVIFAAGAERVIVPGEWILQAQPSGPADIAPMSDGLLPSLDDGDAWTRHMQRLVTLQMPGTQLRVQRINANGWDTLEVRVPTRPTTIVEFDRDALQQLLGDTNANVTLRAFS